MYQFSDKMDNFELLGPNLPKNGFWGRSFKHLKSGFGISILAILCAQIFRQNRQIWIFGSKFAQKWILRSEFQKSKSGFGINTSNIPCGPIFSQNWQLLIFGLNLGKLPNYVQYFGSNIAEGVAESWVEVEMSRVKVDGAGWRWVRSLVIPIIWLVLT